ncbi:hypothetical protein VF04_35045 [Nostoc linckia z7]|uniref:Uncharacterized protein n=1 Tax=Nostoc linckia z7 TaxID=1628745 RepID=A0ABX4KBZ8_NOSLI|nr:hypothetical protein [Nostoc linckia]PHJ53864.1 hypothetical protein VF02_37075 [Nostoc linckia z1]PHJ59280.1 hypothetical protein VF05_32320 [Nostoc linckia z3]PHJ63675.1 hypothetical protein VF03_30195 [Nostoc linckia z2]PHJ73863.1 hypothetical protein VF06_35695 [Nostoc linckia z4]PHJ87196.1 hypothetical protein VF04_35045 [Nostoc linckia z7]
MSQAERKPKEGMKEGEVLPKDEVTVYGTAKSPMGTGKAYKVHSAVVQKLIDSGMATLEDPNANSKPSKEGK